MAIQNVLNYKRLFKNETVSDVYFVVVDQNGAKQRIPALKPLLAAYSPVFDRMFYGELKETGDVEITDVSAEAFEEIVRFPFFLTDCKCRNSHLSTFLYIHETISCHERRQSIRISQSKIPMKQEIN